VVDVLVTHSYHLPYDAKQVRKMQPYMPIATLYAASALREQAIGAVTIVRGSDSLDNPQISLENGFDFVCCGEAESSLVQLCSSILRGEEPPEIDGVVRLDDSGSLNRSPRRLAVNPRWTELPFPARELIDLGPYRKAWIKAHGSFLTNMVSSRGCPYHCNWCVKPISRNKFHLCSAAQVAEEMHQLKARFGAEHIWFGDDIFALDHEWVAQFSAEVVRRDARIPFKIQARANLMSEHVVQHHRACRSINWWRPEDSKCAQPQPRPM
jgi:anaerobic magnesium-protoporphyrin IX monomethyl ester cyclase